MEPTNLQAVLPQKTDQMTAGAVAGSAFFYPGSSSVCP